MMHTDPPRGTAILPAKRFGLREGLASLVAPVIVYGGLALLIGWSIWPDWYHAKNGVILAFSLFALWRYGWLLVNYVRALYYNQVAYPAIQKHAQARPESLKYPARIFFMVPSFKEEPWISLECMRSILGSISHVPTAATIIVATGSDVDDAVISEAFLSHPAHTNAELILQRQSQGKRIAMGHALRSIARRYNDEPDSVTIFMDGDSRLEPQALERILPLFCANPRLGAATTNEIAYLMDKSSATRQWFELKMGQRHVLFQSHSLSRRVLTLTGRFSLIRTSIITSEQFIRQIENDHLEHWMHGRFRFLMGDDKSTWYQLLKDRWEMLYVPDVICYSLESRVTPFSELSLNLPYRWYGNTLRNNSRALALGPQVSGWFIWLAILDQRLAMWTALVGITGAVILALSVSYIYLPFYLAWALIVRTLQLAVIAASGHRVGMLTVPLMLYNQWVGAFVKMHAFFHLSRQNWSKGAQQSSRTSADNPGGVRSPLAAFMPKFHMAISILAFIFTLLVTHHALRLPQARLLKREAPVYEVEAVLRGVWPGDGADDALALQSIFDSLPAGKPSVVRLPAGQLDFRRPVRLTRSDVTVLGAGERQTRIVSHLTNSPEPAFTVAGSRGKLLGQLAQSLEPGTDTLQLNAPIALKPGEILLITAPNEPQFLDDLGSTAWRAETPHLRQVMATVAETRGMAITLKTPIDMRLPAGTTEVYRVHAARNVTLKGFAISQASPADADGELEPVYADSHPEAAVDTLALKWTAEARVQKLRINDSGANPLRIEDSLAFQIKDCVLDGAWNKGEGHGSLVITRSHYGEIEGLSVTRLRNLEIGWSSSHNRIIKLVSRVGIRFSGGFSRHNSIVDANLHVPDTHPWPRVTRTPPGSGTVPPEGPGNEISEEGVDQKRLAHATR